MKNNELVKRLIELNLKISCAESCTGGMLASSIVDVSDASAGRGDDNTVYSLVLCISEDEDLKLTV